MENNIVISEGELFIKDYLESNSIKYVFQSKIEGLKNDVKSYRVADFYLPKYKVYIEFYGLWNNSNNEDYKIKKKVYELNKIPCVYLYPENLGIIGFTLDKRLQAELKKYKLDKELKKYYYFKLRKSRLIPLRIYMLLVFSYLTKLQLDSYLYEGKQTVFAFLIFLSISLFQIYKIYKIVKAIVKDNNHSLDLCY